jgi:hypothetical protein
MFPKSKGRMNANTSTKTHSSDAESPAQGRGAERKHARRAMGGMHNLDKEKTQMNNTIRGLVGSFGLASILTLLSVANAVAQQPTTTTEKMAGKTHTAASQLQGTVEYVEGNTLLVRTKAGDLDEFRVPPNRKFMIDGKELTVGQLKPGTKLTATITTSTTTATERTTTVGSGKVWFVSGYNVIVTLPNGENRMYTVDDSYRFNVDGQKASVKDLRKGMNVSAEKIVEAPITEIAENVVVTGTMK